MDKLNKLYEGIRKIPTDKDTTLLVDEIKGIAKNYSREELLNWLSLTAILKGNELFQLRFSFLKRVIMSMEEGLFESLEIDDKVILNLMKTTERVSWDHLEDYEPRPNGKENMFGFDNQAYYFLPGGQDHPENELESIPKRYFDFQELYSFNVKNEFVRLLQFHTKIIYFLESEVRYNKEGNYCIPEKDSVEKWKSILKKKEHDFGGVWDQAGGYSEPKRISLEIEEDLLDKPLFLGIPYFPEIMLRAFLFMLREGLRKKIDSKIRNKLNLQLKRESLEILTELFPEKALIYNFSINDSNKRIELGFIYDNQFFCVFLIEEKFKTELLIEELNKIEKEIKLLEPEFDSEITLRMNKHTEKINKKLNPVFITILDNLDYKAYPIMLNERGNTIILNYNGLRHIFESLVDKKESIIYFLKVLNKFHKFRSFPVVDFVDFYEFVSIGGNYAYSILEENSHTFLDPHFWSSKEFETIKKNRPRLDYRPEIYELPFTFKFKKLKDSLYFGYNNYIDHQFFLSLANKVKTFVLSDISLLDVDMEMKINHLLSTLISHYISQIKEEEFIEGIDSWIIELVHLKTAHKRGLPKKEEPPISILQVDKNIFHVIFDPNKLLFTYNFMNQEFNDFLINSLIKNLVKDKKLGDIHKRITSLRSDNDFKVTTIPITSKIDSVFTNHSTHLDLFDVEIEILSFLKSKNITKGIYKAQKANKIVKEIYDYLTKKLVENISKYNLESLVKFGLFESDSIIRERKISVANLITSRDSSYLKELQNSIIDRERILRSYFPSLRFLIEKAIFEVIQGTEDIDIYHWQELTAICLKIIELCNISEFLHKQSSFFNVKLKIDFGPYPKFEIILNDNPLSKYLEENIKDFSNKNLRLEDQFPESKENDLNIFIQDFDKRLKEGGFGNINDLIKKIFGFTLPEYVLSLNIMTHLQEQADKYGVIDINRKDLINFVHNQINISKESINAILNFSILYLDKDLDIEPWKVNTRKNRLTVKPLIFYKDRIIFSPEVLILAEENVINSIIRGDWPYKRDILQEDLMKELDSLRTNLDRKFEDYVFDEVYKITSLSNKRLCQKGNDFCFQNVQEKCPGEIDCLSVHPNKKRIFIWEAKNISHRSGSREISNDLDEFLEDKNGYIYKLNQKVDFAKRYIVEILQHYGVNSDLQGWEVIPCIVISSNSLIRPILSQIYNVILFDKINNFVLSDNHKK